MQEKRQQQGANEIRTRAESIDDLQNELATEIYKTCILEKNTGSDPR